MKKEKREIPPEQLAAYEAAMERIKSVTGARTQVQLAELLEVRQSSISDAKRRASIPSDWLLKLQRSHKIHADWFLTGEGLQYLDGTGHATIAKVQERLGLITEDYAHLIFRMEQALDIINMTEAQLMQHKAFQAGVLSVDLGRAKALHAELQTMAADVAA